MWHDQQSLQASWGGAAGMFRFSSSTPVTAPTCRPTSCLLCGRTAACGTPGGRQHQGCTGQRWHGGHWQLSTHGARPAAGRDRCCGSSSGSLESCCLCCYSGAGEGP